MLALLVIADDFTGALDTGIQLAASGRKTKVTTEKSIRDEWVEEVDVLVIDAETRHIAAKDAYDVVFQIVKRAVSLHIPYIYKKTDSALRGNIGAELEALLMASGEERLAFLPAFPQAKRYTQGGVHYIDGVPVDQSVFGADPFEPVRHANVAELIAEQSGVSAFSVPLGGKWSDEAGIYVFDAASQGDLEEAGKRLMQEGALHISAGCAGFAAVLKDLLNAERQPAPRKETSGPPAGRLLMICGSVNPVTMQQVAEAERQGFAHWRLSPEQKLEEGYWDGAEGERALHALRQELQTHPFAIIDSNDEGNNEATSQYASARGMDTEAIRVGVSRALGQIVRALYANDDFGTLLITGGDTLLACMNQMGVTDIEPLRELYPGVVLSNFCFGGRKHFVISKSGGLGQKTLLPDLKHLIQQ